MTRKQIILEGYTPDEILSLPDEQMDAFVFCGEPLVFTVGSAKILGEFRISDRTLVVELAQIDGGGEGVLPALWMLVERYAQLRGLSHMAWIVHALNCAEPNPKLRRLLERKGFRVQALGGGVEAYRMIYPVRRA